MKEFPNAIGLLGLWFDMHCKLWDLLHQGCSNLSAKSWYVSGRSHMNNLKICLKAEKMAVDCC